MVSLNVKITLDKGGIAPSVIIDRRGVKLTNGRGTINVDETKPRHTTTMSFGGPAGATMAYEIKQTGFVEPLVTGKTSVSFGQSEGGVSGRFKLRATG